MDAAKAGKIGWGILRWKAVQTDEQGKEGTAAAGRAVGYVCWSAKAGENLMSYTLMHIRAKENPVLDSGSCLVLNVERRLVTLVGNQCVLAQSQFSRSAFRLLVLLIKFHDGCYYAELFACLFCPEAIFQRVMRASAEDASKLLAPYTAHWRERLADLRRRSVATGPKKENLYEHELKRIRHLVRDKNGIDEIFQEQGFGLSVRVLYRKGYVLRATPPQMPSRRKKHRQRPSPQPPGGRRIQTSGVGGT